MIGWHGRPRVFGRVGRTVVALAAVGAVAASPAAGKHEHVVGGWGHGLGYGDYVDGAVHPFGHSTAPTLRPSFSRVELWRQQRYTVASQVCNYCQDIHFSATIDPASAECRYQALIHLNNVTNRHLHFHNKDCSIPLGEPSMAGPELEGRVHGLSNHSGSY